MKTHYYLFIVICSLGCAAAAVSCQQKEHSGYAVTPASENMHEQPVNSTGKKKARIGILPKAAVAILNEHFADLTVSKVKNVGIASDRYEVKFTNGDEMEFDADGCVTDINTKGGSVPDALVPAKVLQYVRDNYPDTDINDIEFGERKIELKLDNDVELVFDRKTYRLLDIDY